MNFHPSNDDVISAFTKFLNLYFNCNRLTSSFLLQYLDMVQSFSSQFKTVAYCSRQADSRFCCKKVFFIFFHIFSQSGSWLLPRNFSYGLGIIYFISSPVKSSPVKSVNCAESKNSYSPLILNSFPTEHVISTNLPLRKYFLSWWNTSCLG